MHGVDTVCLVEFYWHNRENDIANKKISPYRRHEKKIFLSSILIRSTLRGFLKYFIMNTYSYAWYAVTKKKD